MNNFKEENWEEQEAESVRSGLVATVKFLDAHRQAMIEERPQSTPESVTLVARVVSIMNAVRDKKPILQLLLPAHLSAAERRDRLNEGINFKIKK